MLCYRLSVSICSRKVVTGSQGCGRVWRLLTLGWLKLQVHSQTSLNQKYAAEGCWPAQASVSEVGSPGSGYSKEPKNHTLLPIKIPVAFWFSLYKEWLAAWSELIPVFCTPSECSATDLCSRDFI